MDPDIQAILSRVHSEISHNSITISFSVEGKSTVGDKRSVFCSYSSSRAAGSWDAAEAKLASVLLAQSVVKTVYREAIRTQVLSLSAAKEQLARIDETYTKHLEKFARELHASVK